MLFTPMLRSLPKRLPYRFFSTGKARARSSAIVFTFTVLIGVVVFVYPQVDVLGKLNLEVAEIVSETKTKQMAATGQLARLTRYRDLQTALSPFYHTQPDYLVTTDFIAKIEQWTNQQEVKLDDVIWGELTQQEHQTSQAVTLHLSGSYGQLINLFQYLIKSNSALDIVEFKIQKQSHLAGMSSQLLLELKLHIVLLKH